MLSNFNFIELFKNVKDTILKANHNSIEDAASCFPLFKNVKDTILKANHNYEAETEIVLTVV
ncbi:MAG: hypothetical protein EAZ53_16305 [Bacteroidetes bacterium]|nr:MAG: hypothetical protein EAZ53_16305 [Bacteroidota bacterium]